MLFFSRKLHLHSHFHVLLVLLISSLFPVLLTWMCCRIQFLTISSLPYIYPLDQWFSTCLIVSQAYLLKERHFPPLSLQISVFLTSNLFGSMLVPAHFFCILRHSTSWSESMIIFTVTKYSLTLLHILGFSSLLTMLVLSEQLTIILLNW